MDISEHLYGRTDAFLYHQTASQPIVDTFHRFAFCSQLVALARHRIPMVVVCREPARVSPKNYDDFIRFMELDPAIKTHPYQISFVKKYYQINATTVPHRGQPS
jgi:hypothetical protein